MNPVNFLSIHLTLRKLLTKDNWRTDVRRGRSTLDKRTIVLGRTPFPFASKFTSATSVVVSPETRKRPWLSEKPETFYVLMSSNVEDE